MEKNLIFDRIYVLCLVDKPERVQNVQDQFKDVDVSIHYTCNKPVLTKFDLPEIHTGYYNMYNCYDKVIDCALNHYSIIKEAYNLGLERVLICEDDISLNNNFWEGLKLVPNDFDVLKVWSTDYYLLKPWNGERNLFYQNKYRTENLSTLCYGLSRKGMERYIQIQDEIFSPADLPFFKMYDLNFYRANFKLCEPHNWVSSITNEKWI